MEGRNNEEIREKREINKERTEDWRIYENDREEIKIKMVGRYSNVRKKDINEEYQREPNRKRKGETDN